MTREYSDSIFPFGIRASFIVTLIILMLGGLFAGMFLTSVTDQIPLKNGGGIILLAIFLILMIGPIVFNKWRSPFKNNRTPLKTMDHFGSIEGLRGASIRVLLYAKGIEIRSFYHRFHIPFDKIEHVFIEKLSVFGNRLHIRTNIKDGLVKSPFWDGKVKSSRSSVSLGARNPVECSVLICT